MVSSVNRTKPETVATARRSTIQACSMFRYSQYDIKEEVDAKLSCEGESKVLKHRKTVMLARPDVIDMKGQGIDGSRQMTILTAVLHTLPDFPDNVPSHK